MLRSIHALRAAVGLFALPLIATIAQPAAAEGASAEKQQLLDTIRRLEQRVRELEAQVKDQASDSARTAAPTSPPSATFAPLPSPNEACSMPFALGKDGVRRVRLECLSAPTSEDSCTSPFVLDATGIKRVKRECLTASVVLPAPKAN